MMNNGNDNGCSDGDDDSYDGGQSDEWGSLASAV